MQNLLLELIWVAAGSALGGAVRFLVSGLVARRIGETFPWGTLVVNVSGALAIGAVAAAADGRLAADLATVWPFVVVGFLGSYTTVSSVSLQSLALARDGEFLRAGANVALSLVLSLAAVSLGFAGVSAAFGAGP